MHWHTALSMASTVRVASAFSWLLESSRFGLYSLMASSERSRITLSWNGSCLRELHVTQSYMCNNQRFISNWLCVYVVYRSHVIIGTRDYLLSSYCGPGTNSVPSIKFTHVRVSYYNNLLLLYPVYDVYSSKFWKSVHCINITLKFLQPFLFRSM